MIVSPPLGAALRDMQSEAGSAAVIFGRNSQVRGMCIKVPRPSLDSADIFSLSELDQSAVEHTRGRQCSIGTPTTPRRPSPEEEPNGFLAEQYAGRDQRGARKGYTKNPGISKETGRLEQEALRGWIV